MTIRAECQECGEQYRMSDEKAGRKFRCRECDAVVYVPDEYEDEYEAPARPRRKPASKKGRAGGGRKRSRSKKSKSGANTGLIVGMGAGGVVLVAGIVAGYFMLTGDSGESPAPPSGTIAEPVLTAVELRGYGSDIGEVIGKALDAMNAGRTDEFVTHMFPASELRHPDAATHLKTLQARIAASPEMVEQMKADLAQISEMTPTMKDGGKTAVFVLAGGEMTYGRGKINPPDRTSRFQLVEGSWRLYDNSTAIRKEISGQSALAPPEFEAR